MYDVTALTIGAVILSNYLEISSVGQLQAEKMERSGLLALRFLAK